MFQLSLVDHIRLSFGSVVGAYKGHTAAAVRLARWDWYSNIVTLTLVGVAAAAGLFALRHGGAFPMIAAVSTTIAFAALAVHIAFDPAPRIYAHRAHAARLWVLCEKYRALLTEVHDELLDVPTITARRDVLLQEFGTLFEQSAPADRHTYEIAQKALSGAQLGGFAEQELDQFLPAALRRAEVPLPPAPPPLPAD
jgi:SMODS and SLOG-associating 2TM effector domain family 4